MQPRRSARSCLASVSDADERHPLIVRLAYELGEYIVGDLSTTFNELALRRIEKTLLEIEEHAMGNFGVIRIDQDHDRWQEFYEDLGLPLEMLANQLNDAYIRVASSYGRSRDLVSGMSVAERIAELEKHEGGLA